MNRVFLTVLAVFIAACSSSAVHDERSDGLQPVEGRAEARTYVPPLRGDEFDAASPVSLAEAAKSGEVEAADETYACPMHPDVTSATPDSCPKCGMELVKKETK